MPNFKHALWARQLCRNFNCCMPFCLSSIGLFSELQHRLSLLAPSVLQLPRHAEYVEVQLLLQINTSAVTLLGFSASPPDSLLELVHSLVQDAGRRLFRASCD